MEGLTISISNRFIILFLMALLWNQCNGQIVNCQNKTFLCASSTTFQICVEDINGTNTANTTNAPEKCPEGTFCVSTGQFECSLTTATTTKTPTANVTTTKKPASNITTTKKPASNITTTKKPVSNVTTTKKPVMVCNAPGLYPDPSVKDCKKFIMCILKPQNKYITQSYTCPDDCTFDPVTRICSEVHQCTGFSPCIKVGRYIADNGTCKSYYLCVRNRLGGFTRREYKCPGKSFFNKKTACCDEKAQCITPPAVLPPPPPPSPIPAACLRTSHTIVVADPLVPRCKGFIRCTRRGRRVQISRGLCLRSSIFTTHSGGCVSSRFYRCLK